MIVRYVELPADAATVRALLRANDPDEGTLVVQARPDIRRTTALVHDLLAALGKRTDVKGVGRSSADDLRYLEIWLQAHQVREIVLVESNWIRPGVLEDVLPTLRRADVDLVLGDRLPTGRHHDDLLRDLRAMRASLEDLPAVASAISWDADGFPAVPDDDFSTFLWSCRRLLPSDAFEAVRQRYVATIEAARAVATDPIGYEQAASLLRALWGQIRSADDAVTVVRALQAATFMHTDISVDLARLRRAGEIAGSLNQRCTWRALRAYRQPYRGTVVALAAAGLGIDDASSLPIGAVDPSGRAVEVGGDQRPIPAGAGVFLRAMRLEREQDGARLDQPLLARLGEPISNPSLAQAISDASLDVGVRVFESRVPRRIDDRGWLRQRGIILKTAE